MTEQIRKLRLLAGKTQSKLAQEAGISLPTLQNIEAGIANPSLKIIEAIFAALQAKLVLTPIEPNWTALANCGVPLHAKASLSVQTKDKNFLKKIVSESSLALLHCEQSKIPQTREWEAFAGFLLGLKSHFPSVFTKLGPLTVAADRVIASQNSPRIYKLRRIAVSILSGKI
jgi:transcriptional regulator with XRE-family HTH domain